MDFYEWLKYGFEQGFCSDGVCSTHEGLPMSEEEENEFEDGYDPCIPAVRLYP